MKFKPKKCVICGELFIPNSGVQKICKKDHIQKCSICGKDTVWNSTEPLKGCSKQCRKEALRRYYQEKYGVDHPMQCKQVQNNHGDAMEKKYGRRSPLQVQSIKQKAIDTNQRKFGSNWALGNKEFHENCQNTMEDKYGGRTTMQSDILKSKVESTNLQKYGHKNAMQSEEVRKRAGDTMEAKYGKRNPLQVKEIRDRVFATKSEKQAEYLQKAKQTWLKNLGVDNPSKSPQVMQKIVDVCMEKFGVPYPCLIDSAQLTIPRISKLNREFGQILTDNGINFTFEKTISTRCYDILIPDRNLLIEIDPTYTHNAIGNHWGTGIDKYYHRDKSQLALDNGYRCIHVFDWDDWNKIISSVAIETKLDADDCKIYQLTKQATDEFLIANSYQGTHRNQILRLGLVYNDEIVQVMTFGKANLDTDHSMQLYRLATRLGTEIVGGYDKLSEFASQFGLYNILAYCDIAKQDAKVFESLGMKQIRQTPPQRIWSKGKQYLNDSLRYFGKNKKTDQQLLDEGWLPVYDCGQYVFES